MEARVGGMQNSERQDFKFHRIFSAIIVFLRLKCCFKEQVKTASISVIVFHTAFTLILFYYILYLQKKKKKKNSFEEEVKGVFWLDNSI